jgi:hypothetical protein
VCSSDLEILKKIYIWRFYRAKEENRAIFMFLPDSVLSDIVQSGDSWREVMPPEKARLYGDELEKIINDEWKSPAKYSLNREQLCPFGKN